MAYEIVRLADCPGLEGQASLWFHEKWGIPLEAYLESMKDCLAGSAAIPQWYLAMENGRILGGLGVIENDFHQRKDLTPNVCAVYTEPDRRGQGIAGGLLRFVCADLEKRVLTPCISSPITHPFMNVTAGNSSVWYRAKENPSCSECTFTEADFLRIYS